MDGLEVMIMNTGFAVAVAAFLIKWLTDTLNKKLDKIIETQEILARTLSEVATTQKLLVQLVDGGLSKPGDKSQSFHN